MRTPIATLLSLLLAAPAFAQAPAKDTLIVDLPNDVSTMDPHLQSDTDSGTVYRNMFDSLVAPGPTGKVMPSLATAWHYVNDTTIAFDLRTDVTFSDGSKLTPDDVAFSVRRITDPATKSSQLAMLDQIVAAEVTGPAQVTLHTKLPWPVLMNQMKNLTIVPKAYLEKVGAVAFNQQPIGTGPYKLRTWQRGVQSVFDAYDGNWRGKVPFRSVIFRAVPDSATRVADLRAGRADVIRQMTADDAAEVKADPKLQVLWVATERVGYLFINALWGPTKNVRVRQAVAMAIDRDTIISALLQGYGGPVNIMLTPVAFGFQPDIKPWPFDPARARALIKEAGAEGQTLIFLNSPAYDRRITEAIQQMLVDVGLKVQINNYDMATYLKNRQGEPAMAGSIAQGRWSCACQDADGTIWPLFRSGSNWAKYSNPEFDKVVDAARTALDEKQRMASYHRAFEILREDVPALPLYQDAAIYGARRELKWQPSPDESFFVITMQWQN
jgi:peptide/nickel transport system substrate-binding protein